MKCPVALQLMERADAPAISTVSYQQLDLLIRRLATPLAKIESSIIAFIPTDKIEDIALFFSAWRLGKAVYPLSFRLPSSEIDRRIKLSGATLVKPLLSRHPYEADTIDLSKVATMIETSSGSKLACHTLAAHLVSANAAVKVLDLNQADAYCLNLPLFHISGIALMIRTFYAGARLLLKEEIKDATHISAVSTQIYRYVKDRVVFPKLRCLLIGGGPFPENLKNAPYPFHTTYGMTESASMITLDDVTLPHIETKIENGEVWVRSRSLLSHYFGNRAHSGWFATGNTGLIENGKLVVTGRLDRVFISGGEKIQPEAIERALLSIPEIIDAKVLPFENAEFGQLPKALIRSERDLSLSEIQSHLRNLIPSFMIPKQIKQASLDNTKFAKMS